MAAICTICRLSAAVGRGRGTCIQCQRKLVGLPSPYHTTKQLDYLVTSWLQGAILEQMAELSRDDILKLARLVRVSLSDDEAMEFKDEFSEILKYVEQLQSVDVTGLEPTSQVTGLTNVMREDEIKSYGYEPKDLLKNVPAVQDDQLKVKRMLA